MIKTDIKEERPKSDTFIFVVGETPNLGMFNEDKVRSLTEKGKEYTLEEIDYWLK